jgi:hypothetical protein
METIENNNKLITLFYVFNIFIEQWRRSGKKKYRVRYLMGTICTLHQVGTIKVKDYSGNKN